MLLLRRGACRRPVLAAPLLPAGQLGLPCRLVLAAPLRRRRCQRVPLRNCCGSRWALDLECLPPFSLAGLAAIPLRKRGNRWAAGKSDEVYPQRRQAPKGRHAAWR